MTLYLLIEDWGLIEDTPMSRCVFTALGAESV